MKFWLVSWFIYFSALIMGLGFPGLGRLDAGRIWWLGPTTSVLAFCALLTASVTLILMIARRFFPAYWWLAQVESRDLYEYDGVYFIGARSSRQKTRLQKIVFGVDETMRRWDIVFGLLLLALLVPHLMGGYTAARAFDRLVAERPVLAETLHGSTLSALPVMQTWKRGWTDHPSLAREVRQALRRSRSEKKQDTAALYRIAQLHLLSAFKRREAPSDPFRNTPGERVAFMRARGAEAAVYLNRILSQNETGRRGWTRGALTLLGFFHMSDGDYGQAAALFGRALATAEKRDKTRTPRHRVALLAAQNAMLAGQPLDAERLLEPLLADEKLPPRAMALATEHFAAALSLRGKTARAAVQFKKALKRYERQKNRLGIARMHLRFAALDMEAGRALDASRNISKAASFAHGLDDGFTLNMVEGLSQYFVQVL